jgi:glycosyltransferase involved in cell wall biosynthesis
MSVIPKYQDLFIKHNACVLLPTYNNAGTLAQVLQDVLSYTDKIIVVNDGSTDDTEAILQQFPQVHTVNYTPNKGKGVALRTGIKEAAKLGYDHAIAMDSDGQHYAKDLQVFLKQLDETPGALMIGARNMDQAHIPGKSSFGNRFSNFWFWVNTGIRMPDTQSGYRLYPVQKLAKKKYITRKYEFEIEVIVRASWSGIPVISVPVSVYYPKPEDRVSHFRPFKDFTRISILNTFLVLIAVLYIKPRDFIKMLLKKEGWVTLWKMLFINPQESNQTKAASVGFGIFMGIVPVWGFQLAIGIPLSILFRMNKALFLIAANISIFPFTPFIWMASLATGKMVLGYDEWSLDWHTLTLERVKQEGLAFFLGGAVLAVVASIVAYTLTYGILALTRKSPKTLSRN